MIIFYFIGFVANKKTEKNWHWLLINLNFYNKEINLNIYFNTKLKNLIKFQQYKKTTSLIFKN